MLLEGVHIPLTTPFYPDGKLNLRKLEHNVDRYSRTPAAGMVVLSSIGEPETLSDVETRETLATALGAAGETKVMIAGIACGSVATALDLVGFVATAGYDAVLVKRPALLGEGQLRETVTFFQAVADRSPIPVILDSASLASLAAEAVAELSSHSNVIGLFDGDTSVARIEQVRAATSTVKREAIVTTVFAAVTRRMLAVKEQAGAATFVAAESLGGGAAVATAPPRPAIKTRTKAVGFQVVAASSAGMLAGLRAGAVGVMPAFAAAAPQASYEVYAAWKDDDQPLADEKQLRITSAIAQVEVELGVPGIRYASDLNGYFGGRPRLPLLPLTGPERAAVEQVMDGIRN
ncbi:dihydrodipicolinate synthase family protein [Edaphobacter albus]|uniref:dihydrodipicolinate synthase family protein n=1 Tax=Edaphobacter sp. 4G125 TaxID=2763071 RepID=UPI001646C456|nr:dihydrodipicolinate synthase family protein [Edaphobacter sp. 4G125]QNI35573.1 dihydrodipicolinate synthase family protein [Edaphobacter sp. 4G125]